MSMPKWFNKVPKNKKAAAAELLKGVVTVVLMCWTILERNFCLIRKFLVNPKISVQKLSVKFFSLSFFLD